MTSCNDDLAPVDRSVDGSQVAPGPGRSFGRDLLVVRRFRVLATASAGVWLFWLGQDVEIGLKMGNARGVAGIVATAAFALWYLVVFWVWRGPYDRHRRPTLPTKAILMVVMVGLAVAMAVPLGAGAVVAGVYLSVACVFLARSALRGFFGAVVVASITQLAVWLVPGWAAQVDWPEFAIALLTGFAVFGVRRLMDLTMALKDSNQRVAQLAVADERVRVARDLHDILGHSLTVVTVKAELAGRLLDVATSESIGGARGEIADIERIARDALSDVRSTINGYRELSLPAELAQARVALAAAEISCDLPGSTDAVPTRLRAVYAWAIREGVTNVVRHSGATHCQVTFDADGLRIRDNGRGLPADRALAAGNGLRGLRERTALVGSSVVTSTGPGNGFELALLTREPGPS